MIHLSYEYDLPDEFAESIDILISLREKYSKESKLTKTEWEMQSACEDKIDDYVKDHPHCLKVRKR
jgi:hypothetical protein